MKFVHFVRVSQCMSGFVVCDSESLPPEKYDLKISTLDQSIDFARVNGLMHIKCWLNAKKVNLVGPWRTVSPNPVVHTDVFDQACRNKYGRTMWLKALERTKGL